MRVRFIFVLVLLAAGSAAFAGEAEPPAQPLTVKVANSGRRAIHAVYLAPPRAGSWGQNLLGSRTLKAGEQADLELASGCGTYDVRLVADEGIEYLDDEVRLCGDSSDMIIAGENDLSTARAASADRASREKR